MKIGIITYKKSHKKTQIIANNLKAQGKDVSFFFIPFKNRKKRKIFFNHRPNEFKTISNIKFCKKKNIKFYKISKINRVKLDSILITIGILIDTKKIKKKIINCHSGLLPYSRGLDCFKWDIFYNKKVGVTLHYIDDEIDLGEIIFKRETKLVKGISLKKFSLLHYKNEIDLLSNFYKYLKRNKKTKKINSKNEIYKRMSYNLEKKLHLYFNSFKKKYIK